MHLPCCPRSKLRPSEAGDALRKAAIFPMVLSWHSLIWAGFSHPSDLTEPTARAGPWVAAPPNGNPAKTAVRLRAGALRPHCLSLPRTSPQPAWPATSKDAAFWLHSLYSVHTAYSFCLKCCDKPGQSEPSIYTVCDVPSQSRPVSPHQGPCHGPIQRSRNPVSWGVAPASDGPTDRPPQLLKKARWKPPNGSTGVAPRWLCFKPIWTAQPCITQRGAVTP